MRDFSEIAKELRLSKNLTQAQLAERLWVKKSIISAYETDARPVSLDMLIKYAREFHVSTDYLLGLQAEKTIPVDGLSDSQIALLHTLINEFYAANRPVSLPIESNTTARETPGLLLYPCARSISSRRRRMIRFSSREI